MIGSFTPTALRATVGALVTLSVLGTGSAQSASLDETVKARQAKMKELGGYLKSIRNSLGKPSTVIEQALAVKAIGEEMPSWFPDGSLMGDSTISVKTEALQTISTDREGFEEIAEELAENAEKLAEIAEDGDRRAMGKQFGAMAKASCGPCHDSYRVE